MKLLMNFSLFLLTPSLVLASPEAKTPPLNVLSTELATVEGKEYKLVFSGDGAKCSFDRLTVFAGKKELATFEDHCGQKTESTSKNDEAFVLKRGKFSRTVKLGPTDDDVYVLLSETDDHGASHAVLIQLGAHPALAVNLSPEGTFRDYNSDGLLDHLVEGGKGPRKGDGNLYDPYQVAIQKKQNGKIEFVYDEELSKKFSLESDYLWHGPKADPTVTVDPHGKRLP